MRNENGFRSVTITTGKLNDCVNDCVNDRTNRKIGFYAIVLLGAGLLRVADSG